MTLPHPAFSIHHSAFPLGSLLTPWTPTSLEVYWPMILQGILVSVALGLIGCFLVVRGLSLLGDALSHSVLPGIVLGFLVSGSLSSPLILVGATIMGLLAGVLVHSVHHHSRVKEDASLGIVFTTLFALGVVMINRYAGQADLDPGCVLYGNIEHFIVNVNARWVPAAPGHERYTFDPRPLLPMALILLTIVVLLVVFYRQLLVTTFDRAMAISLGINATLIHYGLLTMLSLTVVASFEAVGAVLAVALLIMPGATARLWTDRMGRMLFIAAGHAILSTLFGYWLAHRSVVDTSAAGAITVAGFALFLLSWLFAPRTGLLTTARQRRRLSAVIDSENLVKAIEELKDDATFDNLAKSLNESPKALRRRLNDGIRRGWFKLDAQQRVHLTDAGRAESARLTRAHDLWEQYLQQDLGLPPDHVHDAAEWIEHHLSKDKLAHLAEHLQKPPSP